MIEEVRAEPFETARWIGVAGRHFGWGDRGAHPAPVFRKEFVGERASGGRLAITGAGYYYAELNGHPVTDARLTPTPSNYDRAVHWTEYDVAPLLRDGTNVLEVTLGSGFYDYSLEDNFLMSQASWRDRPMLIAELRDASGRVRLATDATWDVCVEGPWRFDSIRRGTVYDARRTATRLAETVRKGGHLQRYGIFGAKYVPRVLMDFGFADDALKLVKAREYPSVLHYLERGATTLWERYDGSDSRNHVMFGDMSAWIFRYLGGFRFDESRPGELILEPVAFREVGSFKATYRGITSAWTFADDACTYTVSVPAGGRVTLRLPNREPVTLSEGLHEFRL